MCYNIIFKVELKIYQYPAHRSRIGFPHMGRALGRLLDLGLDSCFDQQVMEKSANTHPIEKKSANTHPIEEKSATTHMSH